MALPTQRPRILLWDLETSPMEVTTFTLYPNHINHNQIRKESQILTGSWKWLGQKEVESASINPRRPTNDKGLIKTMHKVLRDADVLVAHNGDRFDLRKFNARAVFHKLPPLPKIPTIDTLKVARSVFAFNSNRLDYLDRFLHGGKGKIKTDYDLWERVMEGDAKALLEMITYNKEDVRILERVYRTLRPYINNHPNVALYTETTCCPTCGSKKFIKRGFKYQKTTYRQQYQCQAPDCRKYFSGKYMGKTEVQ